MTMQSTVKKMNPTFRTGFLMEKLNKYRDMYDINIQLWDEVNIFVNRKDAQTHDTSELTSIGGYDNLDEALYDLVKKLDRMNNSK